MQRHAESTDQRKLRRRDMRIVCVLSALVLIVTVPQAHAQGAPPRPITVYAGMEGGAAGASELSARASQQGVLRVIVGLRETLADEDKMAPEQAKAQRSRLRSSQQAVAAARAGAGDDGVSYFETIPFLALNADSATLQRLLADPRVSSIQQDVPLRPVLLQSVPLIKADKAAALGFGGAGQVVAVIDSGVAKNHAIFAGGKIVSEACYSTTVPGHSNSLCPSGAGSSTTAGSGINCPNSVDSCDHGTHVASIAVGNTGSIKGVARGAKAIAIKAVSRFTSAVDCFGGPAPCAAYYGSDILKGLERVYALRTTMKIAAANMSIGGATYPTACDAVSPAMTSIINKLKTAKIATVIAAGNNGLDGSVTFPGCISAAVTVGATTKSDVITNFTNYATMVDLMAPGQDIRAAVPGGYATFSGTSMATPHVAGAFAILKQAKPTATVTEVQNALSCTGKKITWAGITRSRIDVLAALNVIRSPATGCK